MTLVWFSCDEEQMGKLIRQYSFAHASRRSDARPPSALGEYVDMVEHSQDGYLSRAWLQGRVNIILLLRCGSLGAEECSALSAAGARQLASRLPGSPMRARAVDGLPPVSGLISGLALMWLLIVGGGMLNVRRNAETFQMRDADARIRDIGGIASRLRRASRRRWWGKALLVLSLLFAGSLLADYSEARPGTAVFHGLAAVAAGAVGLRLLRGGRQRILSRPSLRPNLGSGKLHLRRVAYLLLLVVLAGLSLASVMSILVVWYFIGLLGWEAHSTFALGAVILLGGTLGFSFDRVAQRVRARRAHEAMASDPRPHFLYLRNFGDDHQKIPRSRFSRQGIWQTLFGWLSLFQYARFEEVFTTVLRRYGPVIAIGPAGVRFRRLLTVLPPLGTSKTWLPHTSWQEQVRELARTAQAVVVSATPKQVNPGFAWELEMLAKDLDHGRVVLLFGTGAKPELYRNFQAFLGQAGSYPLFASLAACDITDGTLVMVHVPSRQGGSWYGWGARTRTAWTYVAAISEAMDFARAMWDDGTLASAATQGDADTDPLPEAEWSEAILVALDSAAGRAQACGTHVDTKSVLLTLMKGDVRGEWQRICLLTGSTEAIERRVAADSCSSSGVTWRGASLTSSCATAMTCAAELARSYDIRPVPPALLVLAMVNDPSSAASLAMGIDSHDRRRRIADLVQEDLLGARLAGLRLNVEPNVISES
ncbi:hypothetical protein ACWEN6_17320 [Sphaerisporangium sp. NPDC004334]